MQRHHIAITGWEGTGKSTLVEHIRNNFGFFAVDEMARMIMPLNKDLLDQSNEELSKQTISGYFTAYHLLASNAIMRSIHDRTLLDPLVYDTLYNDNRFLKPELVEAQIKRINQLYQQEHLIDTLIVLKHPKKDDFIKEQVFSDQDRLYSASIEQYKADAQQFEDIMVNYGQSIKGFCRQLITLDSYCDNPNIITDTTEIIAFPYGRNKVA